MKKSEKNKRDWRERYNEDRLELLALVNALVRLLVKHNIEIPEKLEKRLCTNSG